LVCLNALAELCFERLHNDLGIEIEALHDFVEEWSLDFRDRDEQVLGSDLVMIAQLGFIICFAN